MVCSTMWGHPQRKAKLKGMFLDLDRIPRHPERPGVVVLCSHMGEWMNSAGELLTRDVASATHQPGNRQPNLGRSRRFDR